MKIKVSYLISLCTLPFLAGCGLLLLPLAPVMYADLQSGIIQPVAVVSSKGASLTPKFSEPAKARITVTTSTTVCRGFHFLQSKYRTEEVSLVCNNGLKGKVGIENFMTREFRISVGPKSAPGADNGRYGYLTEVTIRCTGNYNVQKDHVAPFLLECGNGYVAAVSPIEGGKHPAEFKVWISKTP